MLWLLKSKRLFHVALVLEPLMRSLLLGDSRLLVEPPQGDVFSGLYHLRRLCRCPGLLVLKTESQTWITFDHVAVIARVFRL